MRPLTLFLAGLLVLAAVLIGLAVGQFAVPLIRTMVSIHFVIFLADRSLDATTPLSRPLAVPVQLSRHEQLPHP
jgi:hypothetical protein